MNSIYYSDNFGTLYNGDSLEVLKQLEPDSIDMVITSPPYWALRDYHVNGQLGQEKYFEDYVQNLLSYFDVLYNVLKVSGTLWVNLGDTYYGSGKGAGGSGAKSKKQTTNKGSYFKVNKGNKESNLENSKDFRNKELPDRSLCMIPARFAIGMQNSDWILINDIIWHKPNQMPFSGKRRFTHDYEHLFLFVKSIKSYYFKQQLESYKGKMNRWGGEILKADGNSEWDNGTGQSSYRHRNLRPNKDGRNKRSVWSINTKPMKGMNHFAKFPPQLVETPIKAGCPENGTVLDIFMGSGTTAVVAEKLNRKWIGIELNEDSCKESIERILKERK